MKTNAIPAIIMLTAGLIDCILSFYERVSLFKFTKRLLIVLVIFYVLGCVVKIVIDCNFKEEEEVAEAEPEEVPEGDETFTEEEVKEPEVPDGNEEENTDFDNADTE